jgi:hypothetical protein
MAPTGSKNSPSKVIRVRSITSFFRSQPRCVPSLELLPDKKAGDRAATGVGATTIAPTACPVAAHRRTAQA